MTTKESVTARSQRRRGSLVEFNESDCFTSVRNDDKDCRAVGQAVPDKRAFTLAEVLITLVVIGIIAAITVPMIHANYKKQETVSKLKKVYSTLAQAINRSQFENGYIGEFFENSTNSNNLFDAYFKPYLKFAKNTKNYKEAGYDKSTPYVYLNGNDCGISIGYTDGLRASFILDDGVFVMIKTGTSSDGQIHTYSNPVVYIDINGSKKPNKFGKDVFYMVINNKKGVLPYGLMAHISNDEINKNCSKTGNGQMCMAKIMRDGWEIKDDYPW